jgi:hypothetical protein
MPEISEYARGMLAIAAAAFALLAPHPALRLLDMHPFRVHGAHFHAGEAVRVTVHGPGVSGHARTVAGRRGAFSVTVPGVDVPGCTPFVVTAVGRSGDRAAMVRRAVACAER